MTMSASFLHYDTAGMTVYAAAMRRSNGKVSKPAGGD